MYDISVSEWLVSWCRSPTEHTSDSMAEPLNSVTAVESMPGNGSLVGMHPKMAAATLKDS